MRSSPAVLGAGRPSSGPPGHAPRSAVRSLSLRAPSLRAPSLRAPSLRSLRLLPLLAALAGACGGSSSRDSVDAAADGEPPAGADGPAGDRAVQPMPQAPTLGLTCGAACTGPFCVTSDPATCGGTALTQPCVGRANGTYCTRACTSDADCAAGPRSLICLTTCAEYPELAGFCWSPEHAAFLARDLCPAAAPDGGPAPAPDGGPTPPADGGPTGAPDTNPAPPDAGTGPADGAAAGPAIKFCNRLRRNGAAVELTLEVAGQVRLQAASDACAPAVGQACPAIPAGEVAVRLLEGASVLAEDSVTFEAGQEYFATAELDPADNMVFFSTEPFEASASCTATDPLVLPRLRAHSARPAQRSHKTTRWSPGP